MATPTKYSHFTKSAPCGDTGLAVGAKGSEVTVSDSAGALYQSGTAIPSYPTGHAATASKLIAFGTATLDDVKTVATGLTTVSAAIVTRSLTKGTPTPSASSLEPVVFNVAKSSGNLVIRGYGISARDPDNPIYKVSGVACTVDWIAWGT